MKDKELNKLQTIYDKIKKDLTDKKKALDEKKTKSTNLNSINNNLKQLIVCAIKKNEQKVR